MKQVMCSKKEKSFSRTWRKLSSFFLILSHQQLRYSLVKSFIFGVQIVRLNANKLHSMRHYIIRWVWLIRKVKVSLVIVFFCWHNSDQSTREWTTVLDAKHTKTHQLAHLSMVLKSEIVTPCPMFALQSARSH